MKFASFFTTQLVVRQRLLRAAGGFALAIASVTTLVLINPQPAATNGGAGQTGGASQAAGQPNAGGQGAAGKTTGTTGTNGKATPSGNEGTGGAAATAASGSGAFPFPDSPKDFSECKMLLENYPNEEDVTKGIKELTDEKKTEYYIYRICKFKVEEFNTRLKLWSKKFKNMNEVNVKKIEKSLDNENTDYIKKEFSKRLVRIKSELNGLSVFLEINRDRIEFHEAVKAIKSTADSIIANSRSRALIENLPEVFEEPTAKLTIVSAKYGDLVNTEINKNNPLTCDVTKFIKNGCSKDSVVPGFNRNAYSCASVTTPSPVGPTLCGGEVSIAPQSKRQLKVTYTCENKFGESVDDKGVAGSPMPAKFNDGQPFILACKNK